MLTQITNLDVPTKVHKVAVIGAGPAGLSAAAYLARKGYFVQVFESRPSAGGKTRTIPDARLPKEVVEKDIEWIKSLGNIDIKYNSPIELNNINQLIQNQGFR